MKSHQSHNDMSLRHRLMLENYEAAMEKMPQDHRSVVWERASYGEFSELIGQEALWENFRSNPISSGMGGPYFWDDEYLNSIRSIWESPEFHKRVEDSFNNLCSLCGQDFVVNLVEPEVGRPASCNVQGRKIAYLPDLTQIYNVYSLKPYIDAITTRKKPVVMAEIGGGYGGLANKLCKAFPDARYILFDLPEGAAIQYYYLSSFYEKDDFFSLQ
ncbi:putative sugar O-methyltransferase [Magnetospirillum aberrantis]|uniref:Putative sugar O-methyltransferase n=1 Tax=Magnetospirillum aberrantis SpK TaxID=908842 RepID=A0A7C9USB0_9PROT|nr:putative sugar O-methyltransferase [Magnetospirillum aberrantis]NFV79188.1 putative sugar O-methyltransferase [Magnetospirillum aberrantis SpK]